MSHEKYEIRAEYSDHVITVYQAFSPPIATPAIKHQKLVSPFSYRRMTWIKPSFLWMMYRSDWGLRAGQERILKIQIKRENWDESLLQAVLTTPEHHVYPDAKLWRKKLNMSDIRVQWDPERDLQNQKLNHRSIQVGIGPGLAEEYARRWIVKIEDITPLVHQIRNLLDAGKASAAEALLPATRIYPVTEEIAAVLGM